MSNKLTFPERINVFNSLKIKQFHIWQEICFKILEEMVTLTRQEIYAVLKNLGIQSTPELKACLREYYLYIMLTQK